MLESLKKSQYKYRQTEKGKKSIKRSHDKQLYGMDRNIILERDKYQCRSCGKKEGRLEIHHIDGNGSTRKKRIEKNNNPENLITLCKHCHRLADIARLMLIRKEMGLWSLHYPECVSCGATDSKHMAKGVCNRCYNENRKEYKKAWYKRHLTNK
jgi:hypothetical protein